MRFITQGAKHRGYNSHPNQHRNQKPSCTTWAWAFTLNGMRRLTPNATKMEDPLLQDQSINQHHKNVKIPSPAGRSVYKNKTEKCSKFKCSRVYAYIHAGCNNNNSTIIYLPGIRKHHPTASWVFP